MVISFCINQINVGSGLLQGAFPGERVPQAQALKGGGDENGGEF